MATQNCTTKVKSDSLIVAKDLFAHFTVEHLVVILQNALLLHGLVRLVHFSNDWHSVGCGIVLPRWRRKRRRRRQQPRSRSVLATAQSANHASLSSGSGAREQHSAHTKHNHAHAHFDSVCCVHTKFVHARTHTAREAHLDSVVVSSIEIARATQAAHQTHWLASCSLSGCEHTRKPNRTGTVSQTMRTA